MEFETVLAAEIRSNLNNDWPDNFDYIRYGIKEKPVVDYPNSYINVLERMSKLSKVHNLLADTRSKELFIKVLCFRMLGHRKVKLPLSKKDYWELLSFLDGMTNKNLSIDLGINGWKIHYIDMAMLDLPFKFYTHPMSLLNSIYIKQYEYIIDENNIIRVNEGDIVIDGGACWGDTALTFANTAGNNGHVYAFDFMPENNQIFNTNRDLNPLLKKRLSLVKKALWSVSNKKIAYTSSGPGSHLAVGNITNEEKYAETISIDDFAKEIPENRIDFIKMDIEGAELSALQGAVESLKKFKPELAISVYHSWDDLVDIAIFLDSLDLGYRFYFGHYTIHSEESVLFAKVWND